MFQLFFTICSPLSPLHDPLSPYLGLAPDRSICTCQVRVVSNDCIRSALSSVSTESREDPPSYLPYVQSIITAALVGVSKDFLHFCSLQALCALTILLQASHNALRYHIWNIIQARFFLPARVGPVCFTWPRFLGMTDCLSILVLLSTLHPLQLAQFR